MKIHPERLDLSNQGLTALPAEVFERADSLEVLDLSGNALTDLPDALAGLRRLRVLFASNNHFTHLPEVLGRCPALEMVGFKANAIEQVPAASLPARLRWLILTDNRIDTLPDELGHRSALQKLALAGNRLAALPGTLAGCGRLELLRVSANALAALPAWLAALPRLSWLAVGGNPLNTAAEQAAMAASPLPVLDWAGLTLQARLGEGASGVIHQACTASGEALALKVFKGEVTSDGWPASEMAAAIHAGPHPNLIPLCGRLAGHPGGAQGLAMVLMPPRLAPLAGPPSLASCTRDVYPPGARFELAALRRLAGGIASAVAQLHARGLMHGDLYGHNILHDGAGQAWLGDFGAASFVGAGSPLLALEVRAFGCLLAELIERCTVPVPADLAALRDACLQPPARRPHVADIARALAG